MTVMERLRAWIGRERDYRPPEGRLTESPAQRLPSGGAVQHLPGDGLDPSNPAGETRGR
ncbi:hypothetical protein [Leifsonia sp. 22587]|uniref:hypothetical protein n=1 Tax=Leifsonia sp. 22587 TaxID=3453946 RepID=UPI003F8437AD